jgi:acetylornithine aminotransferase
MNALRNIEPLQHVRGHGLMIGFDVPESIASLKKHLLEQYHIFTGEAKPNVIRLLPSLALNRAEADAFLTAIQQAIKDLQPS